MLQTLCCAALSQALSPTVIAAGGSHGKSGGVTLSYTVGEMAAVETLTGSNNIITQGFHQPELQITNLLDTEKLAGGTFVVYPNPATTEVWFGYEFPESGKIAVTLYNDLGQVVQNVFTEIAYTVGKSINSLNCSLLAAGNYWLQANHASTSGKRQMISKKLQILTH